MSRYSSDNALAQANALNGAATVTLSHCFSAGAAEFPGGTPPGMPGISELLNDPELLNTMKVSYHSALAYVHPTSSMAMSYFCIAISDDASKMQNLH